MSVIVDNQTMQTAVAQKINFLLMQIAEAQINVQIYTQINTTYAAPEDAALLGREQERLARLETAHGVVKGLVTA